MADGRLIFDTKIDESGFTSGLKSLETKTNSGNFSIGKGIKSILGADILRQAGEAVLEFGKDSLETASSLEEVRNVIDTTFGDNADQIYAFGKAAKNSYGMAEVAALDYAGKIGTLLKTAGFSDDQVVQFTQDLIGLSADLASFYNVDIADALGAVRSGLVGETIPVMERFGIDLRATTLGVEKTDSFTQMMARYEALMSTTSDIQGDFQKTQGSYANQARIFETNIQQVQAAVGNMLIPVATDALKLINSIFAPQTEITITDKLEGVAEEFETFNTAVEEAESNFETTEAALAGRAELAETYMTTLESLEGKEIKTDEDIAAIQNAVAALNTLYEGLGLYVDPATGELNENTEAIRNNISALQDLAMQKLFDEQWQTNAEQLAQAYNGLADAQIKLEEAQSPLADLDAQIAGVQSIFDQLFANGFSGVNSFAGQFTSLIPSFDDYFKQNMNGSWSVIDAANIDASVITTDAQNALSKLNSERNAVLEGISEAQSAVDGYNQAIEKITADQAEITARQEKVKAAMTAGGKEASDAAAQGVEDNGSAIADAVSDVTSDAAASTDTKAAYNAGSDYVSAFINGLKSKSIPTLKANTSTSGSGVNSKNYSGLNYVPYDGYVAQLHVGESVLNAREAMKWRSGESTGSTPSVPMLGEKPEINVYIDGERVSEHQRRTNSAQMALENIMIANGVGSR